MAERVGNPVPQEIRDQLERGERPLVYELVTPPKDDGDPVDESWGERLSAVLRSDAQHEVLLTKNRVVVVSTDRGSKERTIDFSVPLDELTNVEPVGRGAERGRIRLEFRDGSSTYVVMGLVMPRPARRFLAAYDAATPDRRR